MKPKIDILKDNIVALFKLAIKENRNIGELSTEMFENYMNGCVELFKKASTNTQKKPYTIKERVVVPIDNLGVASYVGNVMETPDVIPPDELIENKEKLREFLGDIVDHIVYIDKFTTDHIIKAINNYDKDVDVATHGVFDDVIWEKNIFKSIGSPYYKEISVFVCPGKMDGIFLEEGVKMNEHVNMISQDLISISECILGTGNISSNSYSNTDFYVKVKTEFISYFKNEGVAKYTFDAKRTEWDEYANDTGTNHLRAALSHYNRDTSDMESLLDLLITLIIWCKSPECEF